MGRPTKFTPEIAAEVLKALKAGMLIQDAADFAGISRETLHQWVKQGSQKRDQNHPLREFSDAVTKARTSGKLRAVGSIHSAMSKDWKAAAWWLGVTDPKNYGQKVRVTLEQEYTDALARIRQKLPAEVYEQVLDALVSDSSHEGEAQDSIGEGEDVH